MPGMGMGGPGGPGGGPGGMAVDPMMQMMSGQNGVQSQDPMAAIAHSADRGKGRGMQSPDPYASMPGIGGPGVPTDPSAAAFMDGGQGGFLDPVMAARALRRQVDPFRQPRELGSMSPRAAVRMGAGDSLLQNMYHTPPSQGQASWMSQYGMDPRMTAGGGGGGGGGGSREIGFDPPCCNCCCVIM